MLLTKPQQQRFWREWSAACRAQGWTAAQSWTGAQIDNERHAMLTRAGFDSLTQVDTGPGYTRLLKELAVLQENVAGMLAADANKRRQTIYLIQHKCAPVYWQSITQDRFHTIDLGALTDEQLRQLLYTLSDRAVAEHFQSTKNTRSLANAHRRSAQAAAPPPRPVFDPAPSVSPVDPPDTCPRCGTDLDPDGLCDECQLRRENIQANEAQTATNCNDDIPF